jgi:hypothetical protein
MIDQLVAALGQELGLTSKEIADTVWLALQMESLGLSATTARKATDGEADAKPNRGQSLNRDVMPTDLDLESEKPLQGAQPAAELHTPNSQSENGGGLGSELMLKVPDARSLREPLSLAKSLKPLLQKVTAGWSTKLDEAATVERIADEGIWMPVLQPALEPWLDLALVVDESISMHLWQRTLTELKRLLANYGVFRDVRVWSLVTDDEGQVKLRPRLGAAARRQTLHRPSELIDAGGRRLILIATDCVSAIWQDGTVLPALKLWAASGPIAILQMLPEWLWARTGLGFASAVRFHALMPGVPNQQLEVRDLSPWDEVDLEAGVRVPVVTLETEPFLAWAKMVSAKEGAWTPGFIFEPGMLKAENHFQSLNTSSRNSAEEKVQQFRAVASPMARKLSGFLAASPIISLPVVAIIRDCFLPKSKQIHVAEVFLSGLLQPAINSKLETSLSMLVRYEFLDGIREELLKSVTTRDSLNVIEEVSSFISRRLGVSLNTFVSLIRDPNDEGNQYLVSQSSSFAKMTAKILRQLGGEYAKFAESLEKKHLNFQQNDAKIPRVSFPANKETLNFCLAIDRLTSADSDHFAIWVLESPFPGGYTHHDQIWNDSVASIWSNWQQFFSLRELPGIPHVSSAYVPQFTLDELLDQVAPTTDGGGYTGRLMQGLGVALWNWLFDGSIRQSLERCLGMAMGQNHTLHVKLDIRAPELVPIPWEVMQPQLGRPAISLGPQILFSRTVSAVAPLNTTKPDIDLRILLVTGHDEVGTPQTSELSPNNISSLSQEAQVLKDLLDFSTARPLRKPTEKVFCQVESLVEPDLETLITTLDTGNFNVFFYMGHGVPASDGGMLFLQPGFTIRGTELSQILVRFRIRLAVFNNCWGAQPDQQQQQVIPRSSLAEVMLHHGIPAVIAMRDPITDEEALSFIKILSQSLSGRQSIEQAMAVARQHLLTIYKFNQPAWISPVLYMHPQFDGQLLHNETVESTL